jgi:competence protein ComEC
MTALRLFAITAAYAVGVLAAEACHRALVAAVVGTVAVALVVAASVVARTGRRTGSMVLIAALALGWCLAGLRLAAVDDAALATGARKSADAILRGQVLARPELVGGALRFPFGTSRANLDGPVWAVRERAMVWIRPPPARAPRPGDYLEVEARLAPVKIGRARGGAEAIRRARASATRLRHAGIAARAYARPDGVRKVGRSRNPIVAVAGAGQKAAERAISTLPQGEAGLMLGITVGDDSRLDPDMEADFRATGLTHLLAVSGSNLAMFLGAIALGLRAMRLGRRSTLAVLAAATLAFMAITRFEPSVVRAGAMGAVGIMAMAAGAQRAGLHALAVAALGLVVWDPMFVWSPGFQLSALATLGILVIAPRLAEALGPGKVAAAAAVTMGAQLAVGPLIALQFHQASLVALPANLAAMPAVGPATVLGFIAAALGAVWKPLGAVVATMARPFLGWMGWVASLFARIPNASVGTPAGPAAALVVVASIGAAFAAYRARRIRPFVGVAFSILALVGVNTWSRALAPAPPAGLRITALDVGQGDATLVQAPGGATMLVDGGPDERLLLEHLRNRGVRRIDLLVLTHAHADHVDGLAAVVTRYPIGRELDPGEPSNLPSHARYLRTLSERRIPRDLARAGLRYALGPVSVEILGPREILHGTDSDANNNSVVMRLDYGMSSVLMSGEVQENGQDLLLSNAAPALKATLFKVPHHGSGRALREFYAATQSKAALISVGAGNDYGHPAINVLHWCAELGMRVLRTDRSGDVTVSLGRTGGWAVTSERAAA